VKLVTHKAEFIPSFDWLGNGAWTSLLSELC
jgi:hypothetical protein